MTSIIESSIVPSVVPSVKPYHMVMVSTRCAYSSSNFEDSKKDNCTDLNVAVFLPGDIYTGIVCSPAYSQFAYRDCYEHCQKNHIYPLRDNFINVMNEHNVPKRITRIQGLGREVRQDFCVKVQRTNGTVDTDWHFDMQKMHATLFSEKFNATFIMLFRDSPNKNQDCMSKHIAIAEFCSLNGVNEHKLMSALEADLSAHYCM